MRRPSSTTCSTWTLVSIHLSVASNLRRSRLVERFKSSSASSRSFFVFFAWSCRACAFEGFARLRRGVLPLLCADSARLLAFSPCFFDQSRNWSTPSSTLRMRSATYALVYPPCASAEHTNDSVHASDNRAHVILRLISLPSASNLGTAHTLFTANDSLL